jgi:hypothetical protein
LFDTNGKGWISPEELMTGLLDYFNLPITGIDVSLYMSRFDRDRDGRLKYSEFCDSFLPIDPFHASLLAKKAPLNMSNTVRKDLLFYPETKDLLVNCWRLHFDHEREAERVRQNFKSSYTTFDHFQCFKLLDTKQDG